MRKTAPDIRRDGNDEPGQVKEAARRVPSPLTSKSFLAAGAALFGAGGVWLTSPEEGSAASLLSPYAPAIMTLAGSFLGGFLIGWGARRALRTTAIIGGVVLVLFFLLAKIGVDGSAIEQWVHTSLDWLGENLDAAQKYLTALLPSAAAAGTGTFLGYRRKRR
ncbi:MAG: hypothetical protein U9R74_06460 [Pseudomonadota bacterium]|nr:hypothetical protein [Pseudomonadota bacterium]